MKPPRSTAKGKNKAVSRQETKPRKSKGATKSNVASTGQTSEMIAQDNTASHLLSFDADDSFIRELLAGIPSTAWLPTDPLTSDGWFPDPSSSLIAQDNIYQQMELANKDTDFAATAGAFNPAATPNKAPGTTPNLAMLGALQPDNLTTTPLQQISAVHNSISVETNLANAISQQPHATPDERLLASVRAKKETPLLNRHTSKKSNPLHGFAKKHGIGFQVGNQMAILSPALLSSSPPNAKQLRTNPYQYYSPPKPMQRHPNNQHKGRNLLLGVKPPQLSHINDLQTEKQENYLERVSTQQNHSTHVEPQSSSKAANTKAAAAKPSALAHTGGDSGGAKIGMKWEIAQDKLLLRGVRQQRWLEPSKPRDPNRFSGDDWGIISREVTLGSSVVRNAKQCRRRWAVMHAHLGTAIMDFVDSSPTPQSSAQSTPVPRMELTPDTRSNDPNQTRIASSHMRNLRLADLPMSSPPFMPASSNRQDMISEIQTADTSVILQKRDVDRNAQLLSHVPASTSLHGNNSGEHPAMLSLDSLDTSKRWASPAYCQLLADVVQALTDSSSHAAAVVRKFSTDSSAAKNNTTSAIPEAHLPALRATQTGQMLSASNKINNTTAIGSNSVITAKALRTADPQTGGSLKQKEKSVVKAAKSRKSSGLGAPQSKRKSSGASTSNEKTKTGNAPGNNTLSTVSQPGPLNATSQSSGGQAPKNAMLSTISHNTEISSTDQDLNMYMAFLQSLTNDQTDLNSAWSTLFEEAGSSVLPPLNAATTNALMQPSTSSTASASSIAMSTAKKAVSSALPPPSSSSPSALAIQPINTSTLVSKLGSFTGDGSSSITGRYFPQQLNIDDDDANDGDFVLSDSEGYDDDDDNDDDEEDEEGDDEDEDVSGEDDNEASRGYDAKKKLQISKAYSSIHDADTPELPSSLLRPPPSLPLAPSSSSAALAAGQAGLSGDPWKMTLEQLGIGTSTGSTFTDPLADGSTRNSLLQPNNINNNSSVLPPDELLQQLIQGVTTVKQKASSGALGIPSFNSTPTTTALTSWFPKATDPATLSQWSGSSNNLGMELELAALTRARPLQRKPIGEQSITVADRTRPSQLLAAAERANEAAGNENVSANRSIRANHSKEPAEQGRSVDAVVADGQTIQRQSSSQDQQNKDLSLEDSANLSSRGQSKTPRKRKKKATSASVVKALSAAAMIDADGLVGPDQNVMDTEMSGLYQDALQEGEELDVQEELLTADSSEYLFTAEQMSQLREQQVLNFQFAMQSFLISCVETGPHGKNARHWKRQLDQLALWHSLGTRESPSDLMSSSGLQKFGDLIESAERVRARTGAIGMTESGRFAPNPTSFFAIPGITAVIPEIYEAVDEIHRATQLPTGHETKSNKQQGSHGDKSRIFGSAVAPAASASEVRSFDGSMEFTSKCQCTPVTDTFKSAMVLECVFPMLYVQMRIRKRKAEEGVDGDGQGAGGGNGSNKHFAVQPDGSIAPASSNRLLNLPGVKPLAPLPRPIARQLSHPQSQRRYSGSSGGSISGVSGLGAIDISHRNSSASSRLSAIMPLIVGEELPKCTTADVQELVREMREQIQEFKRDIHRVPRYKRQIFVQGSDGVARLEWMKVKIEPSRLPATLQGLIETLLIHSGFQEAMLPSIVAVRKPKNRIHFLDSEDTLLLQGLRLFGLEDVASMRVHLMPCKTASQLRNRMNNLRARRAPANPVKEFCLRRIAPFTLEEEELVRVGVLVYGDEFKQQENTFLVNRPMLAVRHVWNHVLKHVRSQLPEPPT
ncbi:hypothetical protein GGI25_002759 [Coemansia spiralis]|uniref:Myb-like domain-containing protein n=2 Tax=Coemansia TaxID=4863 RepID=A0A9W8KYS0_9FUNG|nr:hypothetical protein EDC05_002121 [Coemansia umbellata]KAJ2677969.1 hypothetical protein GGI25_002759 [Coemansia spiralis]